MFKCIFIKRKLYDYSDNALSEVQKLAVKEHLDKCPSCQNRLERIKTVLSWPQKKKIPQPSEEFWHKFKVELDAKLNERLVAPLDLKPALQWRLKPALVMAVVSVFMLAVSFSLYLHNKRFFIVGSDEDLINEISFLEELNPESSFTNGEEAYIDEFNLFHQLIQNLS